MCKVVSFGDNGGACCLSLSNALPVMALTWAPVLTEASLFEAILEIQTVVQHLIFPIEDYSGGQGHVELIPVFNSHDHLLDLWSGYCEGSIFVISITNDCQVVFFVSWVSVLLFCELLRHDTGSIFKSFSRTSSLSVPTFQGKVLFKGDVWDSTSILCLDSCGLVFCDVSTVVSLSLLNESDVSTDVSGGYF